jgi:hypothetical protein
MVGLCLHLRAILFSLVPLTKNTQVLCQISK